MGDGAGAAPHSPTAKLPAGHGAASGPALLWDSSWQGQGHGNVSSTWGCAGRSPALSCTQGRRDGPGEGRAGGTQHPHGRDISERHSAARGCPRVPSPRSLTHLLCPPPSVTGLDVGAPHPPTPSAGSEPPRAAPRCPHPRHEPRTARLSA